MGSGALRQGEHHIHRLLGFTNSSNNPSRASAEKRCELMQTFHEREAVIGEDSVLGMKNELITHHVLLPKYCILTLPTAMWKNHFFVRQLLGNIGVLLIYGDFGYVSPNDATYPVLITCCLNFQGFLVDVKVDLLIMALRKFLTSSRLFFPSLPKFSSFSNAAQP